MFISKHTHIEDIITQCIFKGDIKHPIGTQASPRITYDERSKLKDFFMRNKNIPPFNKHREELGNINSDAYAAGNLTGAGTFKTAFEKLA